MNQPDPLMDFDRTQWHHEAFDPDKRDRDFRRWLLTQKFDRDYKRGVDCQELIRLMNDIKALEMGEKHAP